MIGSNGLATSAQLNVPCGVIVDVNGNVYIGDSVNHRIRKIDTSRNVTTIAGSGTFASGSADGNGLSATFNRPVGIAVDSTNTIYYTNYSIYYTGCFI
jgi:hypothetical protein